MQQDKRRPPRRRRGHGSRMATGAEPFGSRRGCFRAVIRLRLTTGARSGRNLVESVDGGNSWRRVVDGLEHQYCWSVAISLADSKTLLLSTSKSAYGAHYKESANSIIYRRTGSDAWIPVRKGLPDPQGLRIPVVAASSSEPGVFYCSTEGMVYRSEDDGLQWQELAVQWNSKAAAEHATGMAIVEEG